MMLGLLAAALVSKQLLIPHIDISVNSGPVQAFEGFGAGIASDTSTGWTTPASPDQLEWISQEIWGGNHFNVARIYMDPNAFETPYGHFDLADFYTSLVTSNRVGSAIRNGAKNLLLSPIHIPTYMDDGTGYILDSEIPYYAALLSDFILQFYQHTSWLINWCGVLNEPTSNQPTSFRLDQWPVMIKTLREKLDSRGLQTVQILAPETSQADADVTDDYGTGSIVNAIAADPVAWADLSAVATHSYGLCANPAFQALTQGKPWWVTESGSLIEQNEFAGDTVQAATAASRFLVDMNNGVSHWIYFIGTEFGSVPVTSQISYYTSPFALTILQKNYYLQQLSQAFDNGAVFRHCSSSLDGGMLWQSGTKPHVMAAVAENPDGSFAIGVTNFTSSIFVDPTAWLTQNGNYSATSLSWMLSQSGTAASSFGVTIHVPELISQTGLMFNAYRSNTEGPSTLLGTYPMIKGRVTIPEIDSLELITLRSTS